MQSSSINSNVASIVKHINTNMVLIALHLIYYIIPIIINVNVKPENNNVR